MEKDLIVKEDGDIKAHDMFCNGCERTKKDVMLSFIDIEGEFQDIFMTQDQAINLAERLQEIIERNKSLADC